MSEARSPIEGFRGWEAIVTSDPRKRGVVLSDVYSENLRSSILTVDWTDEPPEIVMYDEEDIFKLEDGYLLIRAAGRTLGFIPLPLIHQCGRHCTLHEV